MWQVVRAVMSALVPIVCTSDSIDSIVSSKIEMYSASISIQAVRHKTL